MMDDEDYLRIEERLAELAAMVGAPEIMDPRCYRKRAEPGRDGFDAPLEDRPLPPRERLLAKIAAIERQLQLLDRSTYEDALDQIKKVLAFSSKESVLTNIPETALIDLDGADGGTKLDLAKLPDLRAARRMLRELAARLADA